MPRPVRRWVWAVCLWAGAALVVPVLAQAPPAPTGAPPALMLAGTYKAGLPLADYWVSEKLDGVRGRWTGHQLLTRGGLPIQAPAWFTADWPAEPMDGELWAGRGGFAEAVSTVRTSTPDDAAWRRLRFMVFDLPDHGGPFDERVHAIRALTQRTAQAWLQPAPQHRVTDEKALRALLRQIEKQGGEGLMLHRGTALYQAGRSSDILKLKSHDDAEAQVLTHLPGKGKYQGLVGALLVHTPGGQRFKLGSGLSDADRQMPPPVGSWVTYRHRGLNDSGLPRFATYLRVRDDMALNGAAAPR